MMLKIFIYIIGLYLTIILLSSCVHNITYYGDKNAKKINYPFITIVKDKDNNIVEKNFFLYLGRHHKTIEYYKNGNKKFQGKARYLYKKNVSHACIKRKGKYKYWSSDGRLIWVMTYKKDTTINPVTQEILDIINKKEE